MVAFLQNRAVAAATIVGILWLLSLGSDPGGYLGTDTGGKTATLQAMVDRGDWSPDVGYWAEEWDPGARYHPLFGTKPTDEGYVQVTSLPMVLAARPLYDVGGYRATLALPIAGTVLAALAAGALVRRFSDEAGGIQAVWVVGLASPLVVYALDLWEHSIGVAAIGWAAVSLMRVLDGDRRLISAAVAGALLALAATMRTEALVYTVVLVGATCVWLTVRDRIVDAATVGASAVAGFLPVWLANAALEGFLGSQSRTDRATGAAEAATGTSSVWGTRLEEGIRTTFAIASNERWAPVFLGVGLTLTVALAVGVADRVPARWHRLTVVILLCFTLLIVLPGLGFVPGLFAAFPVAAAGLAVNRMGALARLLVGMALVALPIVWAFQYIGGAGPQWGGRYALPSTFFLGAAGVAALRHPKAPRVVAGAVVAMSVVVNLFGVAWLWQRSNEVDQLFDDVEAVQGPALIARNQFFLREGGPRVLDERWLSAPRDGSIEGPAEVVREAGFPGFSVLQLEGEPEPSFTGAAVEGRDRFNALGVTFEVIHLAFR